MVVLALADRVIQSALLLRQDCEVEGYDAVRQDTCVGVCPRCGVGCINVEAVAEVEPSVAD